HMPSVSLENARTLHTIRAGWMEPPGGSIAELVPDFVIPFSDAVTVTGPTRPLFWASGGDCIKSRFDLPLATLLTLSRYEEMLEDERDAHGRFPASRSLALRESFLLRPIV